MRLRISLRTAQLTVLLLAVLFGQGAVWLRTREARLRIAAASQCGGARNLAEGLDVLDRSSNAEGVAEAGVTHMSTGLAPSIRGRSFVASDPAD